MSRSKTDKRRNRALNTLFSKGILATTIGIAFLVVPKFFGSSAILKPLAAGLRIPGWLALGMGLVMLGIHQATMARVGANTELPRIEPRMAKHRTDELREVRDDLSNEPAPSSKTANAAEPADRGAAPPPAHWSPAVFAAIEWRRFEAVCEALFAQAGFETRSQSHGADGGVDIWLHSRNATGPVAVVQCKHWQGKAVGVKEVREFFGVMASHQLKRGTYATTSTYTADALKFARDNGINALDGAGLLALIAKRTPEQQEALLKIAHEGEYWRPTCASCGIKMLERTPAKGGAAFWGCSNYPRCKNRLPMVAALRG